MESEPFHISALKSRIAESEATIADLKLEIARKDEERTRMETQIIQLSENIASKNRTIEDLERTTENFKESLEDSVGNVHGNDESKRVTEFLKSESEKRETEVALLTKEKDMLSSKLMHDCIPETQTAEQEQYSLRDENFKLASENNDLTNELDKLARKLDHLAQRNYNLTTALEKRSQFAERLQADFENTINSRNQIFAEVENLKQKLAVVQKSINSILSPSIRQSLRASAADRPSLIPKRFSVSKIYPSIPSPKNFASKKDAPATNRIPKSFDPSTASTLFKSVQENIVKKIVNNIQTNFDSAAISPRVTKPTLLSPLPNKLSDNKTEVQDPNLTPKIPINDARNLLEKEILQKSRSEIPGHKYTKPNMASSSSINESD